MIAFCNSLSSCGCHLAHKEQTKSEKNNFNNSKIIQKNDTTIIR